MKKTNIIIFAVIIFTGVLGIIFIVLGIKTSIKTVGVNTKNQLYANTGNLINKNYELTNDIKEIYIEANAIELEIKESASSKNIGISIIDFFEESDMNFSVDNNKLFIKSLDSSPIVYGKQVITHPKVVITIPENALFNIFEINSRVSDVSLNNINTEKLKAKNDAGKLILNSLSALNIDIDNNVGKIDIRLIDNNKEIAVVNKIGDVSIYTKDITKYNYNIRNNVGTVNIGDNSYTGLQNEYSSAREGENIKVINNLGSVSIM